MYRCDIIDRMSFETVYLSYIMSIDMCTCVCVALKLGMYVYIRVLIFLAGPSDYTGLSQQVTFDTCEDRSCVFIPILEDAVLELNETFTVNLDRTADLHPRIMLDPVQEEILIIDNDGECVYNNIEYCHQFVYHFVHNQF